MIDLRSRVRARLEELNRNPFDAARIGGLNKHFIDDLLIGKKDTVKQTSLPKLAKALDWTIQELLSEDFFEPSDSSNFDEMAPNGKRSISDDNINGVPEYDLRGGASYGGGYALQADDNDGEAVKSQWYFPESWLRGEMRLRHAYTDIIAVDGPSMQPELEPGDRVLIDRSNLDPKQDAIFAVRDGHSVIIKHVQLLRDTDPPRIVCTSSNPKYKPIELVLDGVNVAIIGRVAGRISRL